MNHHPSDAPRPATPTIIDRVLGNRADEAWQAKLAGATIDHLRLDQWQAQKNRFRKLTDAGSELALALDRASHLHHGDILTWDEATKTAVVAHIDLSDVLVVKLDGLLGAAPDVIVRTCFELGHALGNQHWPAVVKGTTVYVPLTVDRKVMASVMKTHAFEGITYGFQPGTEVIPYLLPHEARRLFGGADATPHSHLPGHDHTHDHGHSHGHDHSHGHHHHH
jgi:urease accessory protein